MPRSRRHYRVTIADVLHAHAVALSVSGGLSGVRDLGLIESAIARPYAGYYRSIYKKAAALTHSLSKNHGFVDGNKRTTLLVLYAFLDLSGYNLVGRNIKDEVDVMIVDVVEGRLTFDGLVRWFKRRVRAK